MFIDTHVHLNNKDLNLKLDEVLKDAYLNKVNKFIPFLNYFLILTLIFHEIIW